MVEEGAVQYERDERSQPAVSRRGGGLDPVGVHLTQNFEAPIKGEGQREDRARLKMSIFMEMKQNPPSGLTRVGHFQRSIETVHQFLGHVQPGTQEKNQFNKEKMGIWP